MAVSNADLTRLIFLDCIEQGLEIPDGCDIEALYARVGGAPSGTLVVDATRATAAPQPPVTASTARTRQ